MSSSPAAAVAKFRDLALSPPLLAALDEVGYETPSAIQALTIPTLLQGQDLLGQAQTGTGKTAAFALPALQQTNLALRQPQTLVLAPTRELAIQVAEALQRYASHLAGFHVLPIYGGQSYEPQLRGLKRGVHAVVGTPGRVVDHIKRGTLKLDAIRMLVLDEADEMLRMGFIDDVEWVLQQIPAERQIALFSATMPSAIKRIARSHLRSPAEVTVESPTSTATNIRQRYWMVSGSSKLDALTRLLEVESFEAMIVFARTKQATEELAEKLQARGFSASALNGDLDQRQRERIVSRVKGGTLDIVVATDVAARGLDVERISHVVNYDIPTDTESYVHRIGRTGRAGRSGDAILFVAPRERRLLAAIERATRQPITPMTLPSDQVLQSRREQKFEALLLETIADAAEAPQLNYLQGLISKISASTGQPAEVIAAALARQLQTQKASLVPIAPRPNRAPAPPPAKHDAEKPPRPKASDAGKADRPVRPPARSRTREDEDMETFRVEVGNVHGLKPSNLVGAIANEAGLEGQHIGRIEIFEDHSHVDLPVGMPRKIFRDLQKVWVSGQQLRISRPGSPSAAKSRKPKPAPRKDKPGKKSP